MGLQYLMSNRKLKFSSGSHSYKRLKVTLTFEFFKPQSGNIKTAINLDLLTWEIHVSSPELTLKMFQAHKNPASL